MRKNVFFICIVFFVLCTLIVPCTANLSNESSVGKNVNITIKPVPVPITVTPEAAQTTQLEINTPSLLKILNLKTIQDNSNTAGLQQSTIIDKKNYTESQKKLSTALLMQISASNRLRATSNTIPTEKPVYVYVYIKPGYSTSIIDSFVSDVPNRDEDNNLAVAWVDLQNLETLASLEGVRMIQEVTPPVVNIGSVTSEGDIIHKTANVRSTYGYTGAGMKIGIISNGVDHLAASQATGDLPTDVTVLSNTLGGDEGTAMLEIVHDMVPDAKLYFHDQGSNKVAFNAAIDALVANGCTVICDDVSWYDEPYFEDGIIASHVKNVLSGNNIIYVSSAGNDAAGMFNGSHYQGDFYSYSGTNWNDFSRGTNTTYPSLFVNIPPYSYVKIFLEWNDQFGYSGNDYDLYLSDRQNSTPTFGDLVKSENFQTGSGNPYESITYINTGSTIKYGEIDVKKNNGVSKTLELYIWGNPLPTGGTLGPYVIPINLVSSDSIFGHNAVPDVIAVAAVPASSPSTIEPFSSRGPVTITYPSPEIRQKPDISGVDGVNVTGVGGFGSPFWGTSAAAPHIAAVVAQYWGAHPTLSPAQVRNALYTSASDLGTLGKDTIFGYGLANALAMEGNVVVGTGDKIGITNGQQWYLDNDGSGTWNTGDKAYNFGATGWTPIIGDWNATGYSYIGVTNGQQWYLDWNGNGVWDAGTDKAYSFGAPGWTPIEGDWNNDGKTDIGVTNGQQWYLDMNNNGVFDSGVDRMYTFGASGWTPVVGDWNPAVSGTKIGITNGQQWYLDWNGNGAWDAGTDKAYTFGASGWTPIVGDWNHDGKSDIGVTNGQAWYLDMNNNGVFDSGVDKVYSFGASGWTPIVGDWNGTGTTKIGVTNGQQWYLDSNGNGAWDNGVDYAFSFGAPGWIPIVGKWS